MADSEDYFVAAKYGDLQQVPDDLMLARDDFGSSLLGTAAFHGHLHIVKHLVPRYWSMSTEYERDFKHSNLAEYLIMDAFIAAAQANQVEIVRYLLTHKFIKNINAHVKEFHHETALHTACSRGRHHVVSLLVDHGAKVNATIWGGQTPLMCTGSTKVAAILVSAGAYVNFQSPSTGRTALHSAAISNNRHMIQFLLDHGATHDLLDLSNSSARQFASDDECRRLLGPGGSATKSAVR